jgi:hypothetical protein
VANQSAAPRPSGLLSVVGLLVAGELPTIPIDVGNCVISPLANPEWTPQRQGGLAFDPAPGATGVLVLEPEIRFRAQHAISTVVPATADESEARRVAQHRFDRIVSLLGLAQGPIHPPPLVQVVSVTPIPAGTKIGDPITVQTSASVRANFHGMVINPMSAITESRLVALDAMERAEPHVTTLIRLWGIAEQANRMRFFESDLDACLVHFCKVIEQIAITMQPATPELTERDIAPLVSDLVRDLQLSKPLAERAKAVESAARRLQELKAQGNRRRLVRSLEILAVEDFLRDGAPEVWDLRSSRAGHPSPTSVTDDQVNVARLAAGELLMRYFNWRWAQESRPIAT